MDASQYYSLPLACADRLEFERFMMADHFYGEARRNRDEKKTEPLSLDEFLAQALFVLQHDEN